MVLPEVPGRLSELPSLVVTTHSCARCRSSRPERGRGGGREGRRREVHFGAGERAVVQQRAEQHACSNSTQTPASPHCPVAAAHL